MMASMPPRLGPDAARAAAAGSAASHRSRMVGKVAVMSMSALPSRFTTEGPSTAGLHTRPTSRPSAGSEDDERYCESDGMKGPCAVSGELYRSAERAVEVAAFQGREEFNGEAIRDVAHHAALHAAQSHR